MPVLLQRIIYRSDLQANPDVLYLFGDNDQRVGNGGQAREMRGEPNAVGVRTKALPSGFANSYWSDENFGANCEKIDADLVRAKTHLSQGGIVVIPADGLGTGLSKLPAKAPDTFAYLEKSLELLNLIAVIPR